MFPSSRNFINFFILLVVTHAIQRPGDRCTIIDSNLINIRQGICMERNDCSEYYANKKWVMKDRFQFCDTSLPSDNIVCCPVPFTPPKEGDNCIIQSHPNDIAGECIPTEECEYAKSLQNINVQPALREINLGNNCYSNDSLRCCPLTKAFQKCLEYEHERSFIYGVFQGVQALPEEFPHMAAVGLRNNNNELLWFCGGSLISENFVLTAAHCTRYPRYRGQPPTLVRLGNIALDNRPRKRPPEDIGIKKIYRHPNYKFSSHYHDIGLLQLKCKIHLGGSTSRSIYPACLHTKKKIPTQLEAIGWGLTERGERSNHLLKVTLNVSNHRDCATRFVNLSTGRLVNNIEDETQICAGGSGYDTCEGDSGGPLHYSDSISGLPAARENYVIAGITSFGKGCGLMGVYTRVSAYIPWIESIVWPSNDTSLNYSEEPRCEENRRSFMSEGDRCFLNIDSRMDWYHSVCTNIHNCGIADQLLRRGLQLPICGFNGRHYLVCCLPKNIRHGYYDYP